MPTNSRCKNSVTNGQTRSAGGVDLGQRLFGGCAIDRGDGGDWLAGVDGAVKRDDRLVLVLTAADVLADLGKIFARQNGDDARQRFGLTGVGLCVL